MIYKIAVYHNTVPNKKNLEKTQMLEYFSAGVGQCGDLAVNVHGSELQQAHVAVIQGWISQDIARPHLKLRNQVIQYQSRAGQHTVTADSNLFLYANLFNPMHYLRYSFDGVFANTGNYCDHAVDPTRWKKIQQDIGLTIKDYRSNGNHILVCLQRNGGWSMGAESVASWALQIVHQLRQHTQRPIVLRPHPGDKKSPVYLAQFKPLMLKLNFSISTNTTLLQDLRGCWAVINHNSSPAVGAAIEGYPVFITDPARSQCGEIANKDLALIESPCMPDRTDWVQRLAMSHWNFDELRSGQAWSHMRQYLHDTA
jgi:hypothetical protein